MYNVTPGLTQVWERLLETVIAALRGRGWTDTMEIVSPPENLMSFWRSPDLLLTQTCGYPFITQLASDVQLIATPIFGFPDCDGVNYRSAIVVSEASGIQSLEALRGKIAVINQPDSQSGMNALRSTFAPLARAGSFFSQVRESGAHLASLTAVQHGEADVAAIDCVTLAYAAQHANEKTTGLRILHFTDAVPGLPLIGSTELTTSQVSDLRSVLDSLCEANPALVEALTLKGFAVLNPNDYDVIVEQAIDAAKLGYPVVA